MPQPNLMANIAYVQKLIDYAKNQREFLNDEQFNMILAYVDVLQPIVQQNMVSYAVEQNMKNQQGNMATGGEPDPNQPPTMQEPPMNGPLPTNLI
jgi:hypothetical protein